MIGKTLDGFRIIEPIGTGGMASVYKAYDAKTDRYVAIKTLHQQYSADPSFQTRFELEAKAIAKLEHIHILPMFTYGEEDGIAYMAMRYLETGTLKEFMAEHKLSLDRISRFLNQIANALDYAHSQQIIHRDIKPSNILIDSQENTMLTDFGIAKIVESSLDLTGTGIMGTPQYMSPEQFVNSSNITPAADQYALAVIIYEMITEHTPYEAETPMAILQKQMMADPLPLPRTFRPDLPETVERVLLKALSREPEQRYASCMAFAEAFELSLSSSQVSSSNVAEPATIVPTVSKTMQDSPTEVLPKPPQKKPLYRSRLAIVGILIVLIGIIFVIINSSNNTTGDDANGTSVARATDEPSEITILSPTETNANTPTVTPSPTTTNTNTPTLTASPSATATYTVTASPTMTLTSTSTPTATPTQAFFAVSNDEMQSFSYDFDNTDYDGSIAQLPLTFATGGQNCTATQQDGFMRLGGDDCFSDLGMSHRGSQFLAAEVLLPSENPSEYANVNLSMGQGRGGAVCGLEINGGFVRAIFYYTSDHNRSGNEFEDSILLDFDQWYKLEMQYDAETYTFSCAVDDNPIASYTPPARFEDHIIHTMGSVPPALVNYIASNAIPGFGNIDLPSPNQTVSGITDVDGWMLLDLEFDKLEILVDSEPVGQIRYGSERGDIESLYSFVPNALHSGFYGQFDTRNFENGEYTLEVQVTTPDGIQALVNFQSITIRIEN